MLDAAKDYLAYKRFGNVAYTCIIAHLLCGLAFFAPAVYWWASEDGKFSCLVDKESTATYKEQVEQVCFLRYRQTYNSPLPLYGFVLLSIGSTVLIGVIYSLLVRKRVEEIESNHERETVDKAEGRTNHDRRTIYVFYCYFVHLVLRALFGITFIVLQHSYFYPNGFDSKFSCSLPETDHVSTSDINAPKNTNRNSTSLTCENATASEKTLLGRIATVVNGIVVFVIILEVIYLLRRFPVLNRHSKKDGGNCDSKFVTVYLLGKQCNVPERQPLTNIENNSPDIENNSPDISNRQCSTVTRIQDFSTLNCSVFDCIPQEGTTTDNSIQDTSNQECSTKDCCVPGCIPQEGSTTGSEECRTQDYDASDSIAQSCCTKENSIQNSIHFYKQEVKKRSRAHDIYYIQKISLDGMYIDVIIHTERARHKFSPNMKRHEINDVYTKVPSDSIRLEKIKDLFYPNKDTKEIFPRSILAIGRPGIGKTVLTEKLLCDWANEIDEFYCDKIVFFFKLRLFDYSEFKNISLKTFLQLGSRLDTEKVESIYQKIVNEPQKAIFIFDGLDECNDTSDECFDQSNMIANDQSKCMSGISLFIKLVRGEMLRGATVLVTSRPSADDFYSKLDFDRNVEIIGFTSDKIEGYVSRFCDNKNRSDLKQTMWNHIKSSSELLNLCYIPVNCWIICGTLYECFNDLENDSNVLPKTLTELYEVALYNVGEKHQRNADANCSAQETLKNLQRVAFNGMKDGKLVFSNELFNEQMKASGLLNHLSDSISPDQFCFTHLTLQEFLASRHVTETLTFAEIKTFISDHIKLPKWHLVLQFISGLLGKKINKFPEESVDCISTFVEGLIVITDKDNSDHKCVFLNHHEVLVMKCLREVNNEEIAKDVCETIVLNDIVELCSQHDVDLSSNEWAAVTAVCKHMSNLAILVLQYRNEDSLRSVRKLLEKRCIKKLELKAVPAQEGMDQVFSALTKVSCTLKDRHTCSKLTSLKLVCIHTSDERFWNICSFFENGNGSHLEKLDLCHNKFSRMTKLFKTLKSECCPKLAYLCLASNAICDEDAEVLWDALTKGLRKLTELDVSRCQLTNQCIPSLCKGLQDERCQLTVLSLNFNNIGDEGACTLFETAYTKENCKLAKLRLRHCSLTDHCVPALDKALKDRRRSIDLDLNGNPFTEEDKRVKKVTSNRRDRKRYFADINL